MTTESDIEISAQMHMLYLDLIEQIYIRLFLQ